jgi:23S rRNA pseudouridine1911/1915/1917 synthase
VIHTLTAGERDVSKRVDHFLQEQLPQYSRSRLQTWIKDGHVTIDGAPARVSHLLHGGETIVVQPTAPPPLKATAEALPVEVLYEDPSVFAINKPSGLVVHAGAGNHSGTLVNRLVHHFQTLSGVGGELRPGIVHRLDKDTSGILLVARNDAAHRSLAAQFSGRTVEKTYLALVHGSVRDETGRITRSIMRDPVHRTRMACAPTEGLRKLGREALTEYRVLQRSERHTYLEVRIGTGRTHQIRVHLSQLGHPIAGDTLYGAPAHPEGRPWLHAFQVTFTQPTSGTTITLEAPLPPGLEAWKSGLL